MKIRLKPTQTPLRRSAGKALYDSAVRQARAPQLYASMGAPDTVEGRFELLTLHVVLLIERLASEGAEAAASSQVLFDTYLSDLDGALREMGVSDLSVPKRMRSLGGAFYGRAGAYREALKALPDQTQLEAVVARTVMGGGAGVDSGPLAAYVARCHGRLADMATERLLNKSPDWPTP